MGFLEKIKLPEKDKNFLFRDEYLASFKYSLYLFSRKSSDYYQNFFYLEGEEGIGKSWLIKQFSLFCKNPYIAPQCLNIHLDCKKVFLSEVLGIINFMLQIRNLIVEKEPMLAQAFGKFDLAYKSFLDGSLVDDGELIPSEEDEERELNKARSTMQAMDAKSRLSTLRSKKPEQRSLRGDQSGGLNLTPESINNKLFSQKRTPEQKSTAAQVSSSYSNTAHVSKTHLPRMKDGDYDVKAIARNLTSAVESMKKGAVKQIDYKTILIKKFLYAFEIVCTNRRLVLIMDNFEKIQPIFNFVFNGFLKNIRNEFLLVIGSHLDMEKELRQKYKDNLFYAYLQNFSFVEVGEYLASHNLISEAEVVDDIIELTKGSPTGVALVSSAFKSLKNDIFKIKKFLEQPGEEYRNLRYVNVITLDHLPQHDKKTIILLSLIREFDPELVALITGVFNANTLIQSLSEKYHFIEEKGVPELVQRFTRTYAKHEMPGLYDEVHRQAFDFYSNKLNEDPENKKLIINALYYFFRVSEERAYKYLLQIIAHFISVDLNFCEEIIAETSSSGVSKDMRNKLTVIRESIPYFILRDYKKTLPLLEAISELQRENTMQILEGF